jgi:ssDNA thymidine ADP-ribosyltransferase, DarT
MTLNMGNLYIYRIMKAQRLEDILTDGIYCKLKYPEDREYPTIGNKDIIDQRSRMPVKCFPGTVVNDYVPFYFSVRTPMLYNIKTGHGVPQRHQRDIIYLCYKLNDLATEDYKWCYTDGNAAKSISKFFTDLDHIETNIDWRSIRTTDFRDNNSDGDEDRVRKKHSEFLVKNHVPSNLIRTIVVFDQDVANQVGEILGKFDLKIKVAINPNNKFYF